MGRFPTIEAECDHVLTATQCPNHVFMSGKCVPGLGRFVTLKARDHYICVHRLMSQSCVYMGKVCVELQIPNTQGMRSLCVHMQTNVPIMCLYGESVCLDWVDS